MFTQKKDFLLGLRMGEATKEFVKGEIRDARVGRKKKKSIMLRLLFFCIFSFASQEKNILNIRTVREKEVRQSSSRLRIFA